MFSKVLRAGVIAAFAIPASFAGTLRVGVPEIDGNQVVLPVLLEGDTAGGVAALDFTLNYDPAVFTPLGAQPSAAAQAARKQVESNEVGPGNYVVMMFGMNQTTVDNGQVATITLKKKSQPSSNQSDVTIAQTTFASIEGQEIASEGSSQTVTFAPPAPGGGGNDDPPPVDETPPPRPPTDGPAPAPKPPDSGTPPPTPSVPGGTPNPPDKPDGDSPRVAPMAVASTVVEEPGPHSARTSGVARMNRAAQQLDQSRAALGPSAQIGAGAAEPNRPDDAGDGKGASAAAKEPVPERETGETKIAAAAATGVANTPASHAGAPPPAKEAPDGSGIPPTSRIALMLIASAVAVALIAYRFTRRSAQ